MLLFIYNRYFLRRSPVLPRICNGRHVVQVCVCPVDPSVDDVQGEPHHAVQLIHGDDDSPGTVHELSAHFRWVFFVASLSECMAAIDNVQHAGGSGGGAKML